jgi:hypothetical protein
MVRKGVPEEVQIEILTACRRRCAVGFNRDTNIKQGQIAHWDHNAANPSPDNLVFLCLDHHDEFDCRTSQSKGLTSDELRHFREELVATIGQAWRQPIRFGGVAVQPEDGLSGRWVRGDDFDSAEIEVERLGDTRIRVHGFALQGKTWDIGPNFGEIDFESELADRTATFTHGRPNGRDYVLNLHFTGDRVIVNEEEAFGYFGAGAHFAGEYARPR